MLSVVYGSNNKDERVCLWDSLKLASNEVGNKAWITGGHFNIVRASSESLGGGNLDIEAMIAFNDCIKDVELVEHPHSSSVYTWCRNWKDSGFLRTLDRVLCNQKWFDKFGVAMVEEPKPFKYQQFWSKHESFNGIVRGCWDRESAWDGMYSLHCKLKEVKKKLMELNKGCFSNISPKVKEKKIELDEVNNQVYGGNLDPTILTKAANINEEYRKLCDVEKQLYQNNDIIQWYRDGDASTSFFHKHMRIHQVKHRITHMQDSNAILVEDIVTRAETKEVILHLKLEKAPGPDGFSTEFYKDSWPIVGRLKETLNDVVGIQQTTYVPGRAISDGIMLIQELVYGYHRKSGKLRLSNIIGIPVSALLVRYLGIALTTKQIGNHDCRTLVEKVRQRIDSWGSKNLSFAGRVTLVNSILFGVCNYWCQTTFIPNQKVKDIEKIMKQYMWKGATAGKYIPKVSWKQATLKKEEGGLGIKDIRTWNMACMAKHVWDIYSGKEVLWVKWLNTIRLKGLSFWGIKDRSVDSWVWRKILALRENLRPHVK
ncbi:reverse transcriptase [Lithospermum erythrorhizon]|uniref:Reverse transcriptase n=1 Tax=Lithospermum erythrorhizon TaxID=34254 RepID=A0AAV3QH88_LITER